MNKKASVIKHFDFFILDLICLLLSFVLAYYIRHNNLNLFNIDIYKEMIFLLIVFDIILFLYKEPYKNVLKRGYLKELRITFSFDTILFTFLIVYFFLVKSSSLYSRIVLFLTYLIYFTISYLTRNALKYYVKTDLLNNKEKRKSLFIICNNSNLIEILNSFNNDYEYFISGLCIFDSKQNKKINGINVVDRDGLVKYISNNWIDEIFITTDYIKVPKKIVNELYKTLIPIHILIKEIENIDKYVYDIETFKNNKTIVVNKKNYRVFDIILKYLIDKIGALFGCILTILLAIIIGPIIYYKSPGPIIYKSDRVGKNGKIFKFYKFRSMVLNADEIKNSLKSKNRNSDGMMFKIENDPRIIPGIGNFIRKTSIDEFPQFINVLKGDMSIVGTRPPTLDEWEKYTPYFRSRLSIKPGITGLWQTSGRSNIIDFNEVVRLDNEYINNWSLSLDIKIIFKTIIQMFSKKNNGSM